MAKLLSAFGYQGNAMDLPVADVDAAAPFYVGQMGFEIVEQDSGPGEPPNEDAIKRVVLERDGVRFAIAENGGDPEQDGCAFHTDDIDGLRAEFVANGLTPGEIKTENRKDFTRFRSFFAVAPDGLCYWFGQKL